MDKKRYHIIIASIIFATLTWISVNMRYEYTISRTLPVVLENVPEGKTLKYPIPKQISVRFLGNGWVLAALYLSSDVKYFIDLSTLGESPFFITGRDLLEHVKLPVAAQVLDVKPESLQLAFDEYIEKRVPVVSHLTFSYHDGYGAGGLLRFEPESVTIGGAQNQITRITGWPTIYRKYDDLRSPLHVQVPLEPSMNYSIEIPENPIRVSLNVQAFAERGFTSVPVTVSGIPPKREVLLIPPTLSIIVRGPIDQLARLNPGQFHASLSFMDLAADTTGYIVPTLETRPEIRIVRRSPERVQFIIRKR